MNEEAFIDNIDDLGDLFGDDAPTSPSPVAQKGLQERLNELYDGGCCQKLAWSKLGGVASVSGDGSSLSIRGFAWDKRTRSWQLSKECEPHVQIYRELSDIVHIAWSPNGLELAVVDVRGRVSILNTYIALDRLRMVGDCVSGQNDTFGRVVGLQWLSFIRAASPYYESASLKDSEWTYSSFPITPLGPLHPSAGKGALVCLTRGGLLRLVYQDVNGWQEASVPLEESLAGEDLFTHASFGLEQSRSLVLVAHDFCHQVQVYRITIDWGLPPDAMPPVPPKPNVQLNPSAIHMAVQHVQVLSRFAPVADNTLAPSMHLFNNSGSAHVARLSHLHVMSPEIPSSSKQESEAITIVAVFGASHPPPEFSGPDLRSNIISRWKIHERPQNLHSTFEKLSSKKQKGKLQPDHSKLEFVERLPDVTVDGATISFNTLRLNSIVALCMEDGSVQFRQKDSMQLISPDSTATTISCFIQGGFTFENTGLHFTLSPNHCLAVVKAADEILYIRDMENSLMSTNDSGSEKSIVSLCTAALTLLFAESCSQSHSNDDVLSVIQRYVDTVGAYNLLREIQIATKIAVDHGRESSHEQLLRSTDLQRCLSLQYILGQRDEGMTVASKLAWITLNLRFTTLHLHMGIGFQDVPNAPPSEMPLSLLRVVKWFFDLASLIVDDAICFSNEMNGTDVSKASVHEIMTQHNSPSLCLLLGSIPRVFLRYDCRCIRALIGMAPKRVSTAPDAQTRKAWINIMRTIESAPVPVSRFENILAEMDIVVKQTYESTNCNEFERLNIEREMLTLAKISETLMPVVKRLLSSTVRKFQDEVNPANLYFADLRWLGLTEDKATTDYHKTHVVDVMRKVVLNKDAPLRRCAVCCSFVSGNFVSRDQSLRLNPS